MGARNLYVLRAGPQGAAAALRPHVQAGTKFFVARVDSSRVRFHQGRAQLSPLRVHYDSPTFSLPVRLGLINSNGTQDLIVHILARGQRYEVANAPNVPIPTNVLELASFSHSNGRSRFRASRWPTSSATRRRTSATQNAKRVKT